MFHLKKIIPNYPTHENKQTRNIFCFINNKSCFEQDFQVLLKWTRRVPLLFSLTSEKVILKVSNHITFETFVFCWLHMLNFLQRKIFLAKPESRVISHQSSVKAKHFYVWRKNNKLSLNKNQFFLTTEFSESSLINSCVDTKYVRASFS